jgi:hypothetical protein
MKSNIKMGDYVGEIVENSYGKIHFAIFDEY